MERLANLVKLLLSKGLKKQKGQSRVDNSETLIASDTHDTGRKENTKQYGKLKRWATTNLGKNPTARERYIIRHRTIYFELIMHFVIWECEMWLPNWIWRNYSYMEECVFQGYHNNIILKIRIDKRTKHKSKPLTKKKQKQ